MNGNTPDRAELKRSIDDRVNTALTETTSDDPIVHIAWLAKGIDVWHSSDGTRGNNPNKAMRYIISSVTRLVSSESQNAADERESKLLDELEQAWNAERYSKESHAEWWEVDDSGRLSMDVQAWIASKRQQLSKDKEKKDEKDSRPTG